MYVRHSAWLNATPKDTEKPRRETYTQGSPYLEMAILSSYEQHILELWYKAGTVTQGANGIVPLPWDEIIAWANKFHSETYIQWVEHPRHSKRHKVAYSPVVHTECTLLDFELELIRRLSQEYCSGYAAAYEDIPCPKEVVLEDLSDEAKLENAEAMKAGFSMFKKAGQQ